MRRVTLGRLPTTSRSRLFFFASPPPAHAPAGGVPRRPTAPTGTPLPAVSDVPRLIRGSPTTAPPPPGTPPTRPFFLFFESQWVNAPRRPDHAGWRGGGTRPCKARRGGCCASSAAVGHPPPAQRRRAQALIGRRPTVRLADGALPASDGRARRGTVGRHGGPDLTTPPRGCGGGLATTPPSPPPASPRLATLRGTASLVWRRRPF